MLIRRYGPVLLSSARPVLIDAFATDHSASGVTSYSSTALTTGLGLIKPGLVVGLAFDQKTVTGVSAVWDFGGLAQSLTPINSPTASPGAFGLALLFGYASSVSPLALGPKTLKITWTGAGQVSIFAASFKNVNQAGGTTSFPNSAPATGTSTLASVGITSAANHMSMAVHTLGDASNFMNAVNNHQIGRQNATNTACGGNYADGAASATLTATPSSTDPAYTSVSTTWASLGTDISP